MKLIYVYDTLCGWCYAASPVVTVAAQTIRALGGSFDMAHRGLFTGDNVHRHGQGFAEYAWGHDQRIAALTGLPFSEAYRTGILGNPALVHASGLTAEAAALVSEQAPDLGLEVLQALHHARFVAGRDLTSPAVVADVLAAVAPQHFDRAAVEAGFGSDASLARSLAEQGRAKSLARRVGAEGTPVLLLERDGLTQRLDHGPFLSQPQALDGALRAFLAGPE